MSDQSNTKLYEWQHRLLPIVVKTVVGLILFFFIATLFQLIYLNLSIKNGPDRPGQIDTIIETITQSDTTSDFEIISPIEVPSEVVFTSRK